MDFFEQQHHARRHTQLMVLMFIVAVAAVVAVLNLMGVIIWAMSSSNAQYFSLANEIRQTPRELYMGITAVTLLIIAYGTVSTLIKLSAGGSAVAEMVGARLVPRDSREALERRILNIVEEMSIASGITMPQVYIMDSEPGINAFAAGYSPNEAVVAVTRGTLENLNRDELQGVIGHEFSHILNGDMRLNIRLMGVIAGIVMIGAMGRFLMNARSRSDDSENRFSSDSNSNSNRDFDWRIFLVGLCLWLIGSIGVLAGRIIKASISRQREFLADASAVQFTRNPEGIGTALYKIGRQNGHIQDRHAEDLSHMYFGESVSSMFGLLDTHPPVEERIKRLVGPMGMVMLRDRVKVKPSVVSEGSQDAQSTLPEGFDGAISSMQAGAAPSPGGWGEPSATVNTTAQQVVDSVGKPTPSHYDAARFILNAIPTALHLATRSETGAQTVLFALLLGDGEVRARQLDSIRGRQGEKIAKATESLLEPLSQLGPRVRMPLLQLLMPSLTPLDQAKRDSILAQVEWLIQADHKVSIGEFVLLTLCRKHLSRPITGAPPVKYSSIDGVMARVSVIISVLAHAGKGGMASFTKGMEALGVPGGVFQAPAELGIARVEAALYELKLLAPMKKPAVIKACLATVMADNKLTVLEGELMRVLCATLDSPLPPLLDTIEPALQ